MNSVSHCLIVKLHEIDPKTQRRRYERGLENLVKQFEAGDLRIIASDARTVQLVRKGLKVDGGTQRFKQFVTVIAPRYVRGGRSGSISDCGTAANQWRTAPYTGNAPRAGRQGRTH